MLIFCRVQRKILNRFDEKETLFTHHYIKSKKHFPDTWNYRNGARTIFNNIKSRCEKLKNNKADLSKYIEEYTEDFSCFSISYADLVKEVKDNFDYSQAFQVLEFSATLYPLIVIIYQQGKLSAMLNTLISVEVRVYKFKGTSPRADIPNLCNDLANTDRDIEYIKDWLVWFKDKFMNDDNIYGNNAVKYILLKYNDLLKPDVNISFQEYQSLQVEHIFPKGGDGVQFDVEEFYFDDIEDYEHRIDMLGNLTLLESKLNSGKDVSDLTPKEKVAGYLQSNIYETTLIASKIEKNGIDKNKLDERTKKIIQFCLTEF